MALNENAQKWVDALRSGEYGQTVHQLRQGDKYCCLGVACEISGLAEWDRDEHGDRAYLGHGLNLPPDVVEWLGLNDHGGGFGNGLRSLVFENDDGASFSEIADIIESEPEGLFV